MPSNDDHNRASDHDDLKHAFRDHLDAATDIDNERWYHGATREQFDDLDAACVKYHAAYERATRREHDVHACAHCADAAIHHLACRGHRTGTIYDSAHHNADDCDRYDRRNA